MWVRTLFRKMWSIRGIFYRLKCYIVPKNKFGHIDSTVFIDLPITFDNPSNVFLYATHTYLVDHIFLQLMQDL